MIVPSTGEWWACVADHDHGYMVPDMVPARWSHPTAPLHRSTTTKASATSGGMRTGFPVT